MEPPMSLPVSRRLIIATSRLAGKFRCNFNQLLAYDGGEGDRQTAVRRRPASSEVLQKLKGSSLSFH
jgi:hypothetical protein